jgi:TolB-like protein
MKTISNNFLHLFLNSCLNSFLDRCKHRSIQRPMNIIMIVTSCFGLGACSALPSLSDLTPWAQQKPEPEMAPQQSDTIEQIALNELSTTDSSSSSASSSVMPVVEPVIMPMYQTQYTYAQVDAYANRLFMTLQHNAPKHLARQSIAVVNFVKFDQALTNVTLLGQHITEHLMQEGQRVGYRIIEHKVTNRIQQSSKGDTVFDYYLSHQAQEFDAVLTGTIIPSPTGLKVHARIVDVNSQMILSSASVLIPRFIVDQLPQRELSDTPMQNTISEPAQAENIVAIIAPEMNP